MQHAGAVALYSAVIVVGALCGALVPLFTRTQRILLSFLAFAAGVMLGAAFFHMLPEAYEEGGGYAAFVLVPVGFGVLLFLERFLLHHPHGETPQVMGVTAFLGLSVHTLLDGVALGSATVKGVGGTAFVAILAHKIPSALSLAAILKAEGRRSRVVLGLAGLYGMMVPFGVLIYAGLQAALPYEAFAAKVLAFSAGTFLYIAVVELLPHVHHAAGRERLHYALALALGLALMFGLTHLFGHPHD